MICLPVSAKRGQTDRTSLCGLSLFHFLHGLLLSSSVLSLTVLVVSSCASQCPHLIQGAPAAGEPGGKSCSSCRGAEGRIHGGERGCGSRHKVGSSGTNHRSSSRHRTGGSAGQKELQTEPNIGRLICHKPVCGDCVRRAEVI